MKFGAVGDIALAVGVADAMQEQGLDWPFARIQSQLDRADLLFGNLECVVKPEEFPRQEIDSKALITPFSGAAVASVLGRAGFDFINLAQNHALDAGWVGMQHTRRSLETVGLTTAGVGASQQEARALKTVERQGIRFGFLCYGEDSNYTLGTRGPAYAYYTREAVLEDIERYRGDVDVLVVSVHADIEFMPTPSVPRLRNFREFARAGADIILGHHPHVPQGCEMVDGCLIAYSLGNFVFPAHSSGYMSKHLPNTARSFLLLVEVGREGVRSFERVPVEIGRPPEERPIPASGATEKRLARYLAQLDAYLQDEQFVRSTWRQVAEHRFAAYLKRAVKPKLNGRSRLRRALAWPLQRLGVVGFEVDMDRVIGELVPRLCLTAENRNWMEEILAMGRERWESWNGQALDPFHRPDHTFRTK
ncbi:MAG: CapA family protein [Gemmatimonadota bacterium]|nr:MAG: CapA family protein [Gemmatimonadota bacterium]